MNQKVLKKVVMDMSIFFKISLLDCILLTVQRTFDDPIHMLQNMRDFSMALTASNPNEKFIIQVKNRLDHESLLVKQDIPQTWIDLRILDLDLIDKNKGKDKTKWTTGRNCKELPLSLPKEMQEAFQKSLDDALAEEEDEEDEDDDDDDEGVLDEQPTKEQIYNTAMKTFKYMFRLSEMIQLTKTEEEDSMDVLISVFKDMANGKKEEKKDEKKQEETKPVVVESSQEKKINS